MVDESLIKQTIAADKLQKVTVRRLISMVESAAETGVDGSPRHLLVDWAGRFLRSQALFHPSDSCGRGHGRKRP